ncbi:hypothetical protein AQI95_41425 [Streptomyces yokosukanensis]|uniref:Acetolactate synthase n=1 Tax=Streptomyces yokosukanensis TaxID=67386 RepID=A0A101NRX1_9ACTN|nr:thiamine pyrophosphate-binding protein [Streptomyces yokosukanensis]KUM98052.1 hypothetical protein AQI95_41425 [Streptomyces yokosukanensis]
MPDQVSGARRLVAALAEMEIGVVFGVPGDTGIALYDELAAATDVIRHVLARDERHAAYMADGYARSTGRLAACEASSGAGAVYLASGLAEAYASSVPVLVITTDIHKRSRRSGAVTEIDQTALFSGVTKWSKTVEDADEIADSVAEAAIRATSGRPGPVALVFPENVLSAKTSSAPLPPRAATVRLQAPDEAVGAAGRILASASQPAILAGGGVHMSGAWPELLALTEHAAIPVATSIHGKGALPEAHALSLGVAGGNGCRGYANDYLADCDVTLIVGSRANATDTNGFTAPPRDGSCQVVHIDIDPSRAGRNFPRGLALVGDAAGTLRALREVLPAASPTVAAERKRWIGRRREEWRAQEAAQKRASLEEGVLDPREVVQCLHDVFGGDAWVVADPGTPTPNLAAYWESTGCAWRVMIPRGIGPMGFAIPAAIGVSVAHPGERVLCVTTESSLAMGVADWETAQRLALPITYVVLDNTSMAWIKMLQHLYMEKRYFGVEPGPVEPVLLARGMGLDGVRAADLAQLRKLAKESLHAAGPRVIHVRIPEHLVSPPPVASWRAALEDGAKERPVY